MEKLTLEQGSPEWLQARLQHFCASEAPAMMGASKFQSRNQLMAMKKGVQEEITPAKQAIFDRGHKSEEMARDLLEIEQMIEFDACVFSKEIDGLPLLASLDGLNETGDLIFEHKLYNKTLAENVINQILSPAYFWQLEHQMLVTGAKEVLFMTSDGGTENREAMTYRSIPSRRVDLIDGWKQFQKDLVGFEVEAKVEVIEANETTLPAIVCTIEGSEIQTNIGACLLILKDLSKKEINKTLETDQDFADKDLLNKSLKKSRAALKAKVIEVKTGFASYAEFEEMASELDSVLQKLQSDGEKKVKQAKDDKKEAIKRTAENNLLAFCKSISETVTGAYNINIIRHVVNEPYQTHDFLNAMKGKRTIESLQNAVDTHTAEIKVKIETALGDTLENMQFLQSEIDIDKWGYLFGDMQELIVMRCELFQDVVISRIDKKAAEEEAETKRIKDEAAAEATKIAEAKAKKDADDLAEESREKIRKEEQEKISKRFVSSVVDQVKPEQVEEVKKTEWAQPKIDLPQPTQNIAIADASDTALLDSGERRAVGEVNVLDVRAYVTNIALENGNKNIDDNLLIEIICEGSEVWISPDIDMHRWYGIQDVVVELEGVFIKYSQYLITGDNSMCDMGLKYDLDDFKIVQQKQRTIVETYYE